MSNLLFLIGRLSAILAVSELALPAASPAQSTREEYKGVDGYTRLEFASGSTVPIGTNYWNELRSPISRLVAGKDVSRTLNLTATYSRHKVDATTTVVSFSHKSGGKGYQWSSEVSNQRLITPYFRIDHDGVVRTSWKLALNKTYEITAVQHLLDVVSRATKLISPSSGLLTTLNKDRFKDTSQFIDQSVSSFLRESVDESAPDEFPLAACVGKPLVSLKLELPQGANVVRSVGALRDVGTWTVRLAPAIRSIFMPATNGMTASGVVDSIGSGTVLDYQVGDQLSLGQFLGGDTAVSAVKDEFEAAGADEAATAAKLCALLTGKLQGLGLNRFDTAVAIHAYAEQLLSGAHASEVSDAHCSILRDTALPSAPL
jgi:hypothetical protein